MFLPYFQKHFSIIVCKFYWRRKSEKLTEHSKYYQQCWTRNEVAGKMHLLYLIHWAYYFIVTKFSHLKLAIFVFESPFKWPLTTCNIFKQIPLINNMKRFRKQSCIKSLRWLQSADVFRTGKKFAVGSMSVHITSMPMD